MKGKQRLALTRALLVVLGVEGVLLTLAAGGLGAISVTVRGEDEVAGLSTWLAVAAVITAAMAALCASSVLAVRSILRYGHGPLARSAAFGVIHLWGAVVAVLMSAPLWAPIAFGVPAAFYLTCWFALKERRRDDLLMLEPKRRRVPQQRTPTGTRSGR